VLCCRRSTHLDIQVLTPEGLKVRCSGVSTSADAGNSSNCADTTSQVDSGSRRPCTLGDPDHLSHTVVVMGHSRQQEQLKHQQQKQAGLHAFPALLTPCIRGLPPSSKDHIHCSGVQFMQQFQRDCRAPHQLQPAFQLLGTNAFLPCPAPPCPALPWPRLVCPTLFAESADHPAVWSHFSTQTVQAKGAQGTKQAVQL
jgi:hypothetical protein